MGFFDRFKKKPKDKQGDSELDGVDIERIVSVLDDVALDDDALDDDALAGSALEDADEENNLLSTGEDAFPFGIADSLFADDELVESANASFAEPSAAERAPFEGDFMDDLSLSSSLDFTITKGSVYEGMTMTAASLDDAAARGRESITNERIRKGDVVLGTYEVESDAISGGMGSVWRVQHNDWGVELAMKRPQPRFFAEAGEARKADFIAECEYWINLGLHPNIVACYYVREVGGVPTIFSEWMGAGSLKDAIASGALYEGDDAEVRKRILDIAIQAARGLAYSHERDLLHQDVKPANILLTPAWDAKVADFGLAKAASKLEGGRTPDATSPTGYTPAYCPAEQAQGSASARWMDAYAWTLTVLEMYAGGRTWQTGAEVKGNLNKHLAQCRVPVPTELQELIGRCLAGRVDDFTSIERELVGIYRSTVGDAYPRDAAKAASDVADVLNNRALSMLDLGKEDEAEELWEQALEVDPMHLASTYNQALHEWRCSCIDDREAQRRIKALMHPRSAELAERLRHDTGQPADILENFDLRSNREIWSEQAEQNVNASKPTNVVYVLPHPADASRVLVASDSWMEVVDARTGQCLTQFDLSVHPKNGILTSPATDAEGRIVIRAHAGFWREWNDFFANREAYAAAAAEEESIVYVWDMQTGQCIHQMRGHEKRVRAVAVDKSGRTAFSSGEDKTLRVWDVASGTCTGAYPLDEEARTLAIDDSGDRLLIGTTEGNIIVWLVSDEFDVGILEGHSGEVEALAFGRDGLHALSSSRNDSLRYWDIPDERCLMTLSDVVDAWKLCGRFPLSAHNEEQVRTLPSDGHPATWELSTVQSTAETLSLEAVFNEALSEARASLEARDIPTVLDRIAAARSCHGFENDVRLDELTRQIDTLCAKEGVRAITETALAPIDFGDVMEFYVTPDGRHALAVARYEIVVWSIVKGREVARVRSDEFFDWKDSWGSVHLAEDGSKAFCSAYSSKPGKYLVFNFSADEPRTTTGSICIPPASELERLPASLAQHKLLSVDSTLSTAVYACINKTFAVDIATGEARTLLDFTAKIAYMNPDGYVFYEAWDREDDDASAFVPNPFCEDIAPRSFCNDLGENGVEGFDRNWKRALSTTEDERVAILDTETGEQIIALDYDADEGNTMTFSSDGRFLFISDFDDHLFVYDLETGKRVYEFDFQEDLLAFVLSEDMHTLYSMNHAGNMRIWRIEYQYSA